CRASEGDHEFALSAAALQVANGFGNGCQRVRLADDWGELAGFDEVLEDEEILVVLIADERAELLTLGAGQHHRAELTVDASEPRPSSTLGADDDESSMGSQCAAQVSQGRIAAGVNYHVVSVFASCEVFVRVVGDAVRAVGCRD